MGNVPNYIALITLAAMYLADGGLLSWRFFVASRVCPRIRLDGRESPKIFQCVCRVNREDKLRPQQHQAYKNGEARLQSVAAEAMHDVRTLEPGRTGALDPDQLHSI